MLSGFMAFLKKFNVIPTAVAFVLAVSLVPVVGALSDVIFQLVGVITGSDDPANFLSDIAIGDVVIGGFLAALATFIIIAFVVYLVIKALNKAGASTDAGTPADVVLLTEIRDLLKR